MSPPTDPGRYDAFDNLRGGMMLLVCVGHAALPYVTVPLTFKDPHTHVAFDVLVVSLYASCMPAFFVMAGFFGALLCARRGAAGFLRNRARAIALPFVVGSFTIAPLTRGAEEFAVAVAGSGSLREGWELLAGGRWIRFDKSFHLWFLLALMSFYSIVLAARWALARAPSAARERLARTVRAAVAAPGRPVFLALLVGLLLVMAELAPGNVGKGAFLQLAMLSFFGLGWLLHGWSDLLPRLERHVWLPLGVAALALPALTWALRLTTRQPFGEARSAAVVVGVAGGLYSACMVYGLLGLFARYVDHPWPAARYVSDASYWIYLAHYPVVMLVGGALSPLDLAAGIKFALVLLIATPVLFASYHALVRRTILGRVLNGKRGSGEPVLRVS